MSTVRQYFDSDFKGFLGPEGPMPFKAGETPVAPPVMWKILYHYDSRACCYAVYVPSEFAIAPFCEYVMQNAAWIHGSRTAIRIQQGFPGDAPDTFEDLSDCVFTKRLVMYLEGRLTPDEREHLETVARTTEFSLLLRDMSYVERRDALETPYAFISHDSVDKAEIARPLATHLSQNLCNVWYDEFSLEVGDSLRSSIERGLKTCKKCILLLTPSFLANARWAKREFDSVFTRELVEEQNLFLPIWYRVTRQDVFNYSPILADRVALDWSQGIDEVTRKLLRVLL